MPEADVPWLALLLARLGLAGELREFVLGDLEEEFHARLAAGNRSWRVRCWYWGQILRSLPHRPPPIPLHIVTRQGDGLMKTLQLDLTFALRGLRRSPGFTAVAVLTLALGVGATTAIFSVVDAVLLAPLPYEEPEQLVMLETRFQGGRSWNFSYPNYADFRDRNETLAALGAWTESPLTLTGPEGVPVRLGGATVSRELLPLLGVEPLHGRGFTADEDRPGGERVALMSHRLWRGRFNGSDVLGRTIQVEANPYVVIGVLPPHWEAFLPDADLVLPLAQEGGIEVRGLANLNVLGRLRRGGGLSAAAADFGRIARQLAAELPQYNSKLEGHLMPYHDVLVLRVRQRLYLLLGAVACVLLIACANISNLLLSRAASRVREVATRRALGAGRAELVRQFLTESVLLTTSGTLLGLGVAVAGTRGLLALAPDRVPLQSEIGLDSRVLAFTLAVTLATSFLFGLTPFVEVGRTQLVTALREATRTAGRGRHRLRKGLVVVEVALAVVLVAGAGLLLRTMAELADVDPGFAHRNVLAVEVALPTPFITPEWRQNVDFFAELSERLERLPGVTSASAAFQPPYDRGWVTSFDVEGRPEPEPGKKPFGTYRPVTPGYFRTIGVPLVAGRVLDAADHSDAPGVVVVNEAFARRYFPEGDALGQRIDPGAWWRDNPAPYEIVGVVGDVKFRGLDQEAQPAMYFPHAQTPVNELTLLLRTAGDPMALADAVRREVWALDPDLPLETVTTVAAELRNRESVRRFMLRLLGVFAAVAVLLAALGLYGVLAYGVTERRREIGVRVALGARPGAVLSMVLGQGLALTVIGLVAGLAGAAALTRYLEALLFGVAATDAATFGAVAVLLAAVAALASLVPAWRATRVDPIDVLRYE